jgi:hypothetical protein
MFLPPVYLTVAAPALHTTSSWDPVPPEQPIAPISFPPSTNTKPLQVLVHSSGEAWRMEARYGTSTI